MKYLSLLFISGAAVFTVSCGDKFLEAEPMTTKTDINYYKTPEDASEALVGCYDALQLIYSDGIGLPVASDIMSDQCFSGLGYTDDDNYRMLDEFDKNVAPAYTSIFEPNWKNYYKGLNRVNTLLSKLDQVEWGKEEELRKTIESEAKFLRAYFYFDMVRMWERVPLLTEPSSENIPQSDYVDTYTLIAQDLEFAIANGSTQKYSEIATTEYGHANKWAAELLMARVYLYYTGYYGENDLLGIVTADEALAYTEDVITNSGHDLVDNFADLWPAASTYEAAQNGNPIAETTYAGETNKEVVFGIKYTYTSDYNGNTDGNHWLVLNGIRKQAIAEYGYGSGWGACTVLPEFYSNWDATDERRDASVMAIDEENITYNQISDMKEYTGYFTKKYIPTCDETGTSVASNLGGVNFMIGQFQDYFVFRYADALLMAAELGSPNALQYVNEVRDRAGLAPVAAVNKDVIYAERMYEFAFEGIRYWDLLRYDSNLDYAASKVDFTGTILSGGNVKDKAINPENLRLTRGLFQIPNNQITLTGGVLTQNNGW